MSTKQAIEKTFGRPFRTLTAAQINTGLNTAIAGVAWQQRKIELRRSAKQKAIILESGLTAINQFKNGPRIFAERIGTFGYIRFENSLGDVATVDEFKRALESMLDTEALVLDFRNTPSGGNTTVARAVLGHFTQTEKAYQVHEPINEARLTGVKRKFIELVAPRSPHYSKPIAVLAGAWTGSMGEGMVIGLDALDAKFIIGAPMADLLGGLGSFNLKKSPAYIEMGVERLYHVNGTAREDFVPSVLLVPADTDVDGSDPALNKAISLLDD